MGNVYVFDNTSICIHGKELLRKFTFHQKHREQSHFKADVLSEKLITEQSDEICGVNPINWKIVCGKNYLWSMMKKSLVPRTRRFTYFRFCFMPWKDEREPQSNTVWDDKLTWFKSSSQYKAQDTIDGESMEFEWNIFPGFTTLQLCCKVQEFLSKMSVEPQDFTGRIIFMSMFNDISWWSEDNEQECELKPKPQTLNPQDLKTKRPKDLKT